MCRSGAVTRLMITVRMTIDHPQLPTNPCTHLSDCRSGTTITAKRPKLIAVENSRLIEVRTSSAFGPTKIFHRCRRVGAFEAVREQRARRRLGSGRRRKCDRLERHLGGTRVDRERHEVVVVDARVLVIGFVERLRGDGLRGQPHRAAGLEQDALRTLNEIAGGRAGLRPRVPTRSPPAASDRPPPPQRGSSPDMTPDRGGTP